MAGKKIILAGGNIILAGGKIILAGGIIIFSSEKIRPLLSKIPLLSKRSLSKHLKGHSGLRVRHIFDSDTNQVFDPEWSSLDDPA